MPIPVEFKTEYPPTGDPVDWVLLAPRGAAFEKVRSWHRVSKLMPPERLTDKDKDSMHWQVMLGRWEQIGPKYKAWKEGQEIPEDGTPLAAWSAITPQQAEVLRKMRIMTVEHVRDMDDRSLTELRFPNARRLPELAAQFLASRDVVSRDEEMASMREKMEAMEEMLAERTRADNEPDSAEQASAGPKPRRGRPPKQKTDEAA